MLFSLETRQKMSVVHTYESESIHITSHSRENTKTDFKFRAEIEIHHSDKRTDDDILINGRRFQFPDIYSIETNGKE